MTQLSNTHATNDMVGIREDLVDVIYNTDPTDTVVVSMINHIAASNTTHEWQTDSLASSSNNAAIEGDEATNDSLTATTRLTNLTQISDKVVGVSGTARAVNTAGRADEFDLQRLKKAKELKKDIEKVICDNKAKVAGNDTLARQCAGIPSYIVTNISEASDATTAAGTGADAHTDGTARAFTEDLLKTVMKTGWDNGAEPTILMCGGFNRQIASTFSAVAVQKAEDSVMHRSYSVYESDFGDLKIVPNREMEARTALCLDMDMLALAHLPGRNMITTPLAKTGDSDRVQLLSEYTVQVNNEKAHCAIYDLTTS